MNHEETIKRISEFHGHLGPYVVIGYRMGLVANRLLGNDPFGKAAMVLTGDKPPQSCLIDGIQLSSGCTLGKGAIGIINQGTAAAIFISKTNKATARISLKQEIIDRIAATSQSEMEALATELYVTSEEVLFEIGHKE
ncbi:MAG: formylmethanofuran dehydrogenase subunit E family protein [Methanobacteriota archaeon]|nr:MAG: formylmethanofuran dehydrogenase subunit E family protein [Euryarchaeota archaeon]